MGACAKGVTSPRVRTLVAVVAAEVRKEASGQRT